MNNLLFTMIMVTLLLNFSPSIRYLPACHGIQDYEVETSWRFSIESGRVNVYQFNTIYPTTTWTSYYQYYTPNTILPENVSAMDLQNGEQLLTHVVTESGMPNITVYFKQPQEKGYKFVLSYYFRPARDWFVEGVGEGFLHWRWGYGESKDNYTLPQNVTVILPPNYALNHVSRGVPGSNNTLEVRTKTEEGRVVCEFNGISPKGGKFEWTLNYRLEPDNILLIISNPNNGSVVSGLLRISANATVANGYALSSLKYRVDDQSWIELGKDGALWNSSAVNDGAHWITFQALDDKMNFITRQIYVNVSNIRQQANHSFQAVINSWLLPLIVIGALSGLLGLALAWYVRRREPGISSVPPSPRFITARVAEAAEDSSSPPATTVQVVRPQPTPSPRVTANQELEQQESIQLEYCYYCGASMPVGSKFCKKCGGKQ